MKTETLNHQNIYTVLPHKSPIALLDSAIFEDEKNITCSMSVPSDCPLAKGHFADSPVIPGTYITEAMSQAAALILMNTTDCSDKKPLLIGISNMRFLSAASFGQEITIKASLANEVNGMADFKVSAYFGEKRIATGAISLFMN